VRRGADLELGYLGKAMPGTPTLAEFPAFGIWRALFRLLGPGVLLASAAGTALLAVAVRRGRGGGAARAGALLGLVGVTQYLVALADGLVEVEKHVLVGNYANALGIGVGALVLVRALVGARELRPGGPELGRPQRGSGAVTVR
jgi:hypothetical protein